MATSSCALIDSADVVATHTDHTKLDELQRAHRNREHTCCNKMRAAAVNLSVISSPRPRPQHPQHVLPAQDSKRVAVAADDELVAGPGQPDVEPFARAGGDFSFVQHEHDGTPLEALEAEHVTVEDLVRVPKRFPIVALPDRPCRRVVQLRHCYSSRPRH